MQRLSTITLETQHTYARSRSLLRVLLCLLSGILAFDATAQYGRGSRMSMSVAEPQRDIFPGQTFTFCRIKYSDWAGGRRGRGGYGWGGRWAIDWPASDLNFSQRLSELTTIKVNRDEHGDFRPAIVELTDKALFNYPFIYMLEVGNLDFSEEEVENLRSYLLRGGFLMVDDFWGSDEWKNWFLQISRVFPPDEYPMEDLPLTHPIFNIVFKLDEKPQIPSLYFWYSTGGQTSERGYDSKDVSYRGIFHKVTRRLMVIVCHNTDLGDGWEREGEDEGYFREISAKKAYPLGINIIVYAMTH